KFTAIMADLTRREKELLHRLFAPGSGAKLVTLFPDTTESDWQRLYSKLLDRKGKKRAFILFVDGASNTKSETAGIGGIIYAGDEKTENAEEVLTFSENIGRATNNEAEYRALIRGVEYVRELQGEKITVYSDSELVVKQLSLEYKVKNDRIFKLYSRAKKLFEGFESWHITHVSRGANRKADILSKQALREGKDEGS
ncbi:MAG: ribonuclease HI family protein, partial [Fidelibacterota bacterium]